MDNKLGLGALVALIISSMVGAGIFSLPQNVAAGASAGAVILGWLVAGIGMVALVMVFQSLSMRKPGLDGGIFSYAKEGFGDFIGFNAAWGYWICQVLANVTYAVVVFSSLGYFFDTPDNIIFGDGNTPVSIALASVLIWSVHALVLRGVKEAAMVNLAVTIAKLLPIVAFCIIVMLAFNLDTFNLDFWGEKTDLGSVGDQVTSTMMATLWAFLGIEGAVVVSSRARKRSDIGRSTIIALLATLVIYVSVTLFSFGVMEQAQLAGLKNPSMAMVLEHVVGPWGATLINVGVIISVLGALLSWTILASEVAYVAGQQQLFPKWFASENTHGAPNVSLWFTTALIQIFLIIVLFNNSTYLALVTISTSACLLPYVFCALYGVKLAWTGETYQNEAGKRNKDLFFGLLATVYCCWLVYAAGINYLLLVALLYAPGLIIFWKAQHHHDLAELNKTERLLMSGLLIAAGTAAYLIYNGTLSL